MTNDDLLARLRDSNASAAHAFRDWEERTGFVTPGDPDSVSELCRDAARSLARRLRCVDGLIVHGHGWGLKAIDDYDITDRRIVYVRRGVLPGYQTHSVAVISFSDEDPPVQTICEYVVMGGEDGLSYLRVIPESNEHIDVCEEGVDRILHDVLESLEGIVVRD